MAMSTQPNSSDILTTLGMAVLAFAGALSKGQQWRDPQSGNVNYGRLVSGIATALVLTSIVRAIGVHYGLEVWAQVALSGVFGYIGPDIIVGVISKMLLQRFGLGGSDDKPK